MERESRSVVSTLCDPMDYTAHEILQARILAWVAFPFFRGIFPTQGLNPGFLHCKWILYQLSHKGNARILVAYPFSNGSSQPRNWTGVSCMTGGFFTNWAIREATEESLIETSYSEVMLLFFKILFSILTFQSFGKVTGLLKDFL